MTAVATSRVDLDPSDVLLPDGLRVVTARRATVPLVEVRLRVPFGVPDGAAAALLAAGLFTGTGGHTRDELDGAFADAGATLRVLVDPQRLLVTGRVLADGLPALLDVLAAVLDDATYPDASLEQERGRLVQRVRMTRAAPQAAARARLLDHCFGAHPFAQQTPDPQDVAAVDADRVRTLHRDAVLPSGSVLTLVGDLEPGAATALVQDRFARWRGAGAAHVLDVPDPRLDAPVEILGAGPGARQAEVRLAGPSVRRDHPEYAACCVADRVFGSYFQSRLVRALRGREGLVYAASSVLAQHENAAMSLVDFASGPRTWRRALDVALAELAAFAEPGAATADEVAAAAAHIVGTTTISLSTQAGLAEALTGLGRAGLPMSWLDDHLRRVADIDVDEVRDVATRAYRPDAWTGVVLAP